MTPTAEHPRARELLAAILADPDCDVARLVYADWLSENGQEARAEFIRVQVELGRNPERERLCRETCEPPEFGGCPQRDLRHREWALLHTNLNKWFNLPAVGWKNAWRCTNLDVTRLSVDALFTFRRGFIDHVTLTAAAWLAHADAIVTRHPIREVTLTTLPRVIFTDVRGKGTDGWTACFAGRSVRRWYGVPYDDAHVRPHLRPHLLAAEWPHIAFTLPERDTHDRG